MTKNDNNNFFILLLSFIVLFASFIINYTAFFGPQYYSSLNTIKAAPSLPASP